MTNQQIRDHYRRSRQVYEKLARVDDCPTIGVNDYDGWYIKRDTDDPNAVEAGYPQEGSVVHLGRDLDALLGRLNRTLYAITTYKDGSSFDRWVPCKIEDGQTEWQGEKPTPGLGDLRAVPAWGDIDLTDDLKPERGDLDADTQATIEAALDAYIGEFADLYGTRDAVHALDSVGGAYIFGAPEATLPIADHYDGDEDALARVMDAFIDRTNEYLEAAEECVNQRVEGVSDVLDPDWVNNLNRQYKAPLSLHKDHDAVVRPLDTDAPDYALTPLKGVDDALVDACVAWAESLTADDHRDCVDRLVSVLWPDEYEDGNSWADALDAWVAEERRREEEQEERRREALIQRERSEYDGLAGLPITPHRQDVYDAIDNLDIEAVAEQTIVNQWTDQASGKRDTSGSGKRAFIPTWGPNANGTANYVNIQKSVWVDTGQNHHGTAVEMALIHTGGWTRGDIAEGEDWGRGVDALRDMGFEIPIYTPDANTADGKQMPYWALRRAALALEVIDEDELVEKEGDDGDTFLSLGSAYDDVLEAVADAGLEHGREMTGITPERPEYGYLTWSQVREFYAEEGRAEGDYYAAQKLMDDHAWMYVLESQVLWKYDEDRGYYTKWGEARAAELLERELRSQYSKTVRSEVIEKLQQRNQVHRDALNSRNQDGYRLCVGNGVIHLETGELTDHSPEYNFTRGLEWDYDPSRADTEPVIEFLDAITRRPEDRDTLLDHLAHGLMPGHSYRAFVMMYGPGSNGKTRVGRLFEGFVGEDNAASVELQDLVGDDGFATGPLPGAFINVGDDVSVSELRDVSVLKSLTGGGKVRANEKYEKKYKFENEAAMFFSANEPPRITEGSEAIGDRLYPIPMPYRFVNDPDPNNSLEKQKVTGVAEKLIADEAAMRGLLVLCVERAKRLIAENGRYSMPEGPAERREIYEAASDPIKRFVLNYLEAGASKDYLILKDDAYAVYTEMCDRENERAATETSFKSVTTKQSILDLAASKTRAFSDADDGQLPCWRWVQFQESAKDVMPDRLIERYFPDDDPRPAQPAEPTDVVSPRFGALRLQDAAESLTGYVTVTVEVSVVTPLGEDEKWLKAVLRDESGAMDMVTWDDDFADLLKEAEGKCVAIRDAEVGEYESRRQLRPQSGVTNIQPIQQGVGFTPNAVIDDGQANLDATSADGGEAPEDSDIEDAKGRILDYVRTTCETGDTLTVASVAGKRGLSPEDARHALDALAEQGDLLEADGEFEVL